MAKWSVALFGHVKPNYYIQDAKTGDTVYRSITDPGDVGPDLKVHIVTGNDRRAKPGDIIAFKPWKDGQLWSKMNSTFPNSHN